MVSYVCVCVSVRVRVCAWTECVCARCVVQRGDSAQQLVGSRIPWRARRPCAYTYHCIAIPVFKVINKLSVPYPALLFRNSLHYKNVKLRVKR